jgi:hypothetical protein
VVVGGKSLGVWLAAVASLVSSTFGLTGAGASPGEGERGQATFDAAAIVETVRHDLRLTRDGLVATDRAYEASFEKNGLGLRLRGPGGFEDRAALRLSTSEPASWSSHLNHAERRVAGERERVIAEDGRLRWTVVLPNPPKRSRPLLWRKALSATDSVRDHGGLI